MGFRNTDRTVTPKPGLPTLRRVLGLVADRAADSYSVELADALLLADATTHRSLAHPLAHWAITRLVGSLLADGWIDRPVADRLLAEFAIEWPSPQ